jgi:hypothetical protein
MANRSSQKGNYAGWKPLASADFDQNYEPISPTNPGPVATTYTARNGDTLQSIARTVWGDASMWYLIADANGLASGQTLSANMVLIIPNKVTNIHNNAGTFRPYNPGEAIGDLNPTIPAMPKPPKKKSCGGLGAIIAAIVTVVVSVIATPAVGAAWASVIGNVAGQLTGMALGVQKGFSFTSLAMSAIGGKIAPFGAGAEGLKGVLQAAGNAAVSNVASQGLNIITGQQKGFSWAGVAAAAVAAPITSRISNSIKDSNFGGTGTAGYALRGAVAGVATSTVNELTRVAIVGGKVSWSSVAIGGISGGIYGYGEGLGNQARATANALNQPVYGNTFDADRQARAQMLGLGNNSPATDTPSVLRLSDDEVFNNAMARQEAEKGFNGLNVSYVLSPEQLNARNGGLNASYGDALGNGVVYGKEQYMKGISRTAGAGDVKGQFVKQNDEAEFTKLVSEADKLKNTYGLSTQASRVPPSQYDSDIPTLSTPESIAASRREAALRKAEYQAFRSPLGKFYDGYLEPALDALATLPPTMGGSGFGIINGALNKSSLIGKGVVNSSVWKLNPFERGQIIEQVIGHNLPNNFPVIDRFINGTATSIKSINLDSITYSNSRTLTRTLTGYVDEVAELQGRTWAGVRVQGVTGRALDLVVPNAGNSAQKSVLNQAVIYGESRGITLNIIKYP